MEIEWTGDSPVDAIAAVRERFGSASSVALAIDLDALFVKRVQLPPLPAAERRRILALEPERFFPVRGKALVVTVREDDDLVFAMPADVLEVWIGAAEALGPVDVVEPAPAAVARALARGGIQDARVVVRGVDGRGTGVVDVADGRVVAARRVAGGMAGVVSALGPTLPGTMFLTPWSPELEQEASAALPGVALKSIPVTPSLAPGFAAAWGAAQGLRDGTELALTSEAHARRVARRRRTRVGVAVTALVAAAVFATGALGGRRARTLAELERQVALREDESSSVLSLVAEANALAREATTLSGLVAERGDPLEVLLAVTRVLPEDAYLRSVNGVGADWELTGYARDAARLIPLLEQSAGFVDARFRGATSRVQVDNRDFEAFSILVRWADAP